MSAKNKNAGKSKPDKKEIDKGTDKKEVKGGSSVKVRHILCEKQVFLKFYLKIGNRALIAQIITFLIFF